MNTETEIFNFDGQIFSQPINLHPDNLASHITELAEDVHGNIWVIRANASYASVEVVNYSTGNIIPLHEYLSVPHPIHIPLQDKLLIVHNFDHKIWIGSSLQAFLYDGSWSQVLNRNNDYLYRHWYPAADNFWVVRNDSRTIRQINQHGQLCDSISVPENQSVLSIWPGKDLSFWLALASGNSILPEQYLQLSTATASINARYTNSAPKPDWYTRKINVAESRLIHFGLHMYTEEGITYLGTPDQPKALNLSEKYPDVANSGHYYIDRQKALWCVSPNALLRLSFNTRPPFQNLLHEFNPKHSIRGIAELGNKLYVNSYSGAKIIDLTTQRISSFGYPNNNLGLALLADERSIWIGSHRNFVTQYLPNGSFIDYPLPTRHTHVFCLLKTAPNIIYIGTNNGLYHLQTDSGKITQIPFAGKHVQCLHQNTSGLWVGSELGLSLLDKNGQTIASYLARTKEVNYEYIKYIYEDESGTFWLSAKGEGIIRWNPVTGASKQYTIQNGLSNDNIHALYADQQGYLWMPSDYGLMRFHLATQTVHTFFEDDGLADNEFNEMAHFRSRDGKLYLGGINGITAFYPDQVTANAYGRFPVQLIETKAFDLRNGLFVYRLQNAGQTPLVRILPNDAYTDFRVSPLLFEEKTQFYYEWKIVSLHPDWIRQKSSVIRLSKLPYGKQQLLVRVGRQGNPAANPILTIPLEVVRPFYLRLPFILLLAFVIVSVTIGFNYWRTRQLINNNLLLEQEVHSRTFQIERDKEIITQQASELRALDEMKSRFFTNVTHELRTPLTLILGPVDHMINHKTSSDKTSAYLLTIQRSAHKLYNLVDELLDLSKMESNKLVLDEKPTMLVPFLKRIFAAFAPFAEQQGLSFLLDCQCPENLCINMDLAKWEKILNNLLSNALKFTPQGGSIVLFAHLNDNLLKVGVSDSGQGIPAEDLPFIFDRYFQTKVPNASLKGGTGIGLSLCKEYARLFGAEISVQSTPGKGSTFSIPFRPQIIQDPNMPATVFKGNTYSYLSLHSLASKHGHSKHTLLLVEDDIDMVNYLQNILQDDYHLLIAANGQIALQFLNTQTIDLVLSDVMMPQMDGFQLLKKSKEINLSLPFILLTARVATDDRLQALQLGVDDYLTKPFVEEELKARLRNLLARYDARRKLHASGFFQENNSQQYDHDITTPIEQSPSFDQQWISTLDRIILENISHSNFSVVSIADKMNTSERNIYYKVRSFTGLTPNQYITEARLVKARQLLELKTFPTVAEVCFAVGLTSPQHFSRIFKNRFGKLPSELLKSLPTAAK